MNKYGVCMRVFISASIIYMISGIWLLMMLKEKAGYITEFEPTLECVAWNLWLLWACIGFVFIWFVIILWAIDTYSNKYFEEL